MHLIAGLGNPGPQYTGTRHNAGFMALDYLAGIHKLSFTDSRWKALVAKAFVWDASVLLMKPQAFMNASGIPVAEAAHFYRLPPEQVIVIHDDLDIECGRVKFVAGGGDGGHRGIRSLIEQLGTKNFPRLKIGIGRPPAPVSPERYVLGRFAAEEKAVLEECLPAAGEGIRVFLQQGIEAAMNLVNQKK